MLSSLRKFIAKPGELRWRGGVPPVRGEVSDSNLCAAQIVRNFRDGQHQIRREIVLIEMDEILQHGKRLMFRGVAEPDARTRPASSVTVRSFTIKRRPSECLPQHAINSAQLIPPKAMRPRMFSTWRAPNSVSMADTGAMPPNARLGCLSQRRARSRSPRYSLARATMRASR